jgi:hypothetical protein
MNPSYPVPAGGPPQRRAHVHLGFASRASGLEALALVGAALPSVFGNVDPRGGRPERVQHEGNSRLVYAGQASHADVEGLDCLLDRCFVVTIGKQIACRSLDLIITTDYGLVRNSWERCRPAFRRHRPRSLGSRSLL